MATGIPEYRTLAGTLEALIHAAAGDQYGTTLAQQIARQLKHSLGRYEAQGPMLAQILAALLERSPDDELEIILFQYVHGLVFSADVTEVSLPIGGNDASAGKIILARKTLLRKMVEGFGSVVAAVIDSASKAHVSSDDSFEVDFSSFLEKRSTRSAVPSKAIHSRDGESDHLHQEVAAHLRFFKALVLMAGEGGQLRSPECRELVPILLALSGLRNREIAESSCQVAGLLLEAMGSELPDGTFEMIWDAVQTLLGSPRSADLAFSTWLRWVSLSSRSSRPSQAILQQEAYWSHLQDGLSTGFSERRKFCLYILNTSLRLISDPLRTRFVTYDPASRSHREAWKKYSTLIEIISLSSSTNQLLAAFPDIRRLLAESSPIHGSWIVVLVALGLGASNGPLQGVIWDFLLSLKEDELARLIEGPEGMRFITGVFLPYAIAAYHFNVQKTGEYRDIDRCEHGEQLCEAVAGMVRQGGGGVLKTLLAFLDKRADSMFPPARVYVLQGLLKGTSGTARIESSGLGSIVGIAKMGRFPKMKTELCVTICLRLLEAVDLQRVTHKKLVDALVEVAAGHEHLLSGRYLADLMGDSSAISRDLENTRCACETQLNPSYKTLLRLALLVISKVYMDKGDPAGYESARGTVSNIRFLSILFSNKRIAEGTIKCLISSPDSIILTCLFQELLQTPRIRDIVTHDLRGILRGFQTGDGRIEELADLTSKIRLSGFIDSGEAEATCLVAWERQDCVSTAHAPSFSQESKQRADMLVICWACANAGGTIFGAPEVLSILTSFEVPMLGQNKHENDDIVRATERFLYSVYGLLGRLVSKSQEQGLGRTFVARLFIATTRLLRFIKGEALVKVLECLASVFEAAPGVIISHPTLASILLDLWDSADAAGTASIYKAALRTVFHSTIIRASVGDVDVQSVLTGVAKDIIRLCTGKRSLAPGFAKIIREAFLASPDVVCECAWAVEVFHEFMYLPTNKDLEFLVETPLARVFDEVCLAGEKGHYERYYGEKEIYSLVYAFDVLARLDVNSLVQRSLAERLRSRMIEPWSLNKPGMPAYSKWKKATQLQCLVVLERFATAETSDSYLVTLVEALRNEPHPRYRFMFEWIISLCIIRFPEHRNSLWGHLQYPENPNPKLQASLLRVCMMVSRELGEELKDDFYAELLYTVIPLTGNNKVAVRHQAITVAIELWDHLPEGSLLRENIIFQRVRQSILNSQYYKEASLSGRLDQEWTFNVKHNYTLTGIFSGPYLFGSDEADIIPPQLFPSSPSFIPVGTPDPAAHELEFTKTERELLPPATAVSAPLQTKGVTWDAKMLLGTRKAREQSRPEIIVIASLVENNYNLGGLSRVSEIMGVSLLCVSSKEVLKSSEFTSVSVHSESWLPVSQLPATDIASFIRGKRAEGFEAVGIEQTDSSRILGGKEDGKRFARKTVLVLGSEKCGIPPELLAELDVCVEIEQVGETRSMNVQTAAAVTLYEICRQLG